MDFYINALDYEEKYDKLLEEYEYLKGYYLNNVSKYEELIDKYSDLQERINKAIQLLNKRKEEQDNGIGWVEMRTEEYFEECDELLQIFQGEDNE